MINGIPPHRVKVEVKGDDNIIVVGKENIVTKIVNIIKGDTEEQRAWRNRQAMLRLVYNTWIEGVLKKSLYNEVLLDLGMETRPDAIDRPWDMTIQMSNCEPESVIPGTPMIDLFNQTNGSLLILGEPGSGKTTMILQLAREAIDCAFEDPIQPIPVIFNLSSWTHKQTIDDWLVEELGSKYYVPKKIAQKWVENDDLMLLLDGLDEVKSQYRHECVLAINTYRFQHNTMLTVCSRLLEYEALNARLKLRGAVLILPLTDEQISEYFQSTKTGLKTIYQKLQKVSQDLKDQNITRTPLLLSILILTYRNSTVDEIKKLEVSTDYPKNLFDAYINQMFSRRSPNQQYQPDQTKAWLKWLAQKMIEHGQTIFYIENINQTWLPSSIEASQVEYWGILLPALVLAVISGLIGGFISGAQNGLFIGIAGGIVGAQIARLSSKFVRNPRPVEKLYWFWQGSLRNLLYGTFLGLLIGIINFQAGGRGFGLVVGLVIWMIGGLRSFEVVNRGKPGQGIRTSFYNCLKWTVVFGMIIGVFDGIIDGPINGFIYGLSIGPVFGEIYGGIFLTYHFLIRWLLYRNNDIPWNYLDFLDNAVDRILLRKVGGGYIFIHRMLMEHFAEMEIIRNTK